MASDEEAAPSVGDDGVYEVDKVVDIMWTDEKGEKEAPLYRVRWRGFPPMQDTWEPIENFTKETRGTVRKFVRRYKLLQEKERTIHRELGHDPAEVDRHVNVLSRHVERISSMRCDTTREPPLWFYLIVWRGERLEDATWESEVALKHAGDLIQQYRDRNPLPPVEKESGKRRSGSSASVVGCSPKLFLDGPTPRKQKEKLKFVANLIDDESLKFASQPKAKHASPDFKRDIVKAVKLHKFDQDILDASSSSISKKKLKTNAKPISSEMHGKKSSSLCKKVSNAVAESPHHVSNESDSAKKNSGKATLISAPTASSSRDENISSNKSLGCSTKEQRFKRIIAESDSSDSDASKKANDNINKYKSKFIKDEKAEEKKRRAVLMKQRKIPKISKKRPEKNENEIIYKRKNEHKGSPFKEKTKQFSDDLEARHAKLNAASAESQELDSQNNSDFSNQSATALTNKQRGTSPVYKMFNRDRVLQEKLDNIFGYDTDSEDLTLSPLSDCSSIDRISTGSRKFEKCGGKKIKLAGNHEENSIFKSTCFQEELICILSENLPNSVDTYRGNHKSSAANNRICEVMNEQNISNCPDKESIGSEAEEIAANIYSRSNSLSNKSHVLSEHCRGLKNDNLAFNDSHLNDSYSSEEYNGCDCDNGHEESFLSALADYDPVAVLETFQIGGSGVELLSEEDFLAAVYDGDYSTVLRYLECSPDAPPSLPYPRLALDAVEGGRWGVAQLLLAAGFNSSDADEWLPVVEAATKQGDLCILLVLSEMLHNDCKSTDSKGNYSSSYNTSFATTVQSAASTCAQDHVTAALQMGILELDAD